jgi:hypothetical protein
MNWKFTLIDSSSVSTVVESPVGWNGIGGNLTRNIIHHGININISTDSFEWVGEAYDLLYTEYQTNGANGQYQVQIDYECAEGDGYTNYFIGAFDFNTFERQCADYCFIKLSVTASKCTDVFMSRMGQDVDIEATTNFDGQAITPPLLRVLNIEGQDILLQNKAFNDGTTVGFTFFPFGANGYLYLNFCMTLPERNMEEVGTFNMNGATLIPTTSGDLPPLSAFITDHNAAFELFGKFLTIWQRTSDPLNCIDNDAQIDIICKGTFNVEYTTEPAGGTYDGEVIPILKLFKYNSVSGAFTLITDVGFIPVITCPTGVVQSVPFNFTYSGTPSYSDADYLFLYWECFFEPLNWNTLFVRKLNISIDYDNTSKVEMTLNSNCEPSVATSVYLPELLKFLPSAYMDEDCPSVVMEEELNQCLDFYQITKGSFIRQVTEPSVPKLFTSYEYLFEQCRKIFNIGWGFDNNETELKIARIEHFYKSTIVVDVGLVDKAIFTTAKDLIYGTIMVGYNKWEAEEYNGLDEMNTERQYRRNIDSNPTELDLMSDMIAAGYTIEITRRKNQARTGTSDWRYDDDLFIVNAIVEDGNLYAYRGIDANPDNVYSPNTRMNYALTPARSLMRWFKSIAAAQPTVANENFIFTSGTGNYIAQGQMLYNCPIEGSTLSEKETIDVSNFDNDYYITPIWKTEYVTFTAPFSMADFEDVKVNPYGAIRFRCSDTYYIGNIVEINHDPNEGLAEFKLLIRR